MFDWDRELKNVQSIIGNNYNLLKNIWSGVPKKDNLYYYKEDLAEIGLHLVKQRKGESIEYSLDENLFRIYKDYKTDSSQSIFCYGCSNTFGIGLKNNETWPYKLAKKLDAIPYNYGVVGASIDQITRVIYNTLTQSSLRENLPSYFYVLFPDIFRSEFFTESEKSFDYCPVNISYGDIINNDFFKEFLLHVEDNSFYDVIKSKNKKILYFAHMSILNNMIGFIKNIRFINLIAEKYNIKWYWGTWDPTLLSIDSKYLWELLGANTYITEDKKNNISALYKNKASDQLHIGSLYCSFLSDQFSKLTPSR